MKNHVIKDKIENKLKNVPQHPLNCINESYKKEFLGVLNELYESGFFSNSKNLDSLIDRLQLSKFNLNQYYQGLSEIMFEIFSAVNENCFSTNKKLRNDRNTDIDLQIIKNGYNFNFEIKTPEFRDIKESILLIDTSFRSISKKSLEEAKAIMQDEIINSILDKSETYEGFEYKKINDNKMLDYLKSGQEKFEYSDDKSLNILVVSVRTNEMQNYWDYLFNSCSGLFTDSTYDNLKNYDKVDIVLLTNLVSGHQSEINGAWDLENYCNLFFPNPYCEKFSVGSWRQIYCELLNLIPNQTYEFDCYLFPLC